MLMIAADATLIVGIVSSLTSLGAAGIAGFGVWYGSKRKAEVDADLGVHAHQAEMIERAQSVLLGTIDKMEAELARQDAEHEAAVRLLRSEHERALTRERERRENSIGSLQAQIDTLRAQHRECLDRNDALERELAELRSG